MFVEVWMSKQWALAQQHYYSLTKFRWTGRWWLISLIKNLCDIAWGQWEHHNGILHHQDTQVTVAMGHQLYKTDT
jgi:hypothetical protein